MIDVHGNVHFSKIFEWMQPTFDGDSDIYKDLKCVVSVGVVSVGVVSRSMELPRVISK
jgi:hypothetical protein